MIQFLVHYSSYSYFFNFLLRYEVYDFILWNIILSFLIEEIFYLFYFIFFRFFFKYYKLFSFFKNSLVSLLRNSFVNDFPFELVYWIFSWMNSVIYSFIFVNSFDFIIYNWFLFPFDYIALNDSLLLRTVELTKIIL